MEHQLAAIMFTDLVGYTSAMQRDEEVALNLINRKRTIEKSIVEKHGGRWLKEIGDGALMSFHSAVGAVNCALNILQEVKDEPGMELRIGIHVGEVIFKDGDVYGDGVNIASRIQETAMPGETRMSEAVYNNVKNKAGAQPKDLGHKRLKNVSQPVRIYSLEPVVTKVQEAPQTKRYRKLIYPLILISVVAATALVTSILAPFGPIEPRIMVLPFQVVDVDGLSPPSLELSENIKFRLSQYRGFKVIGGATPETLRTLTIEELAGEYNVQYILFGQLAIEDETIHLTTTLVDPPENETIWQHQFLVEDGGAPVIADSIATKILQIARRNSN